MVMITLMVARGANPAEQYNFFIATLAWSERKCSSPPSSAGAPFQDPQRRPETADSVEPYVYCALSYTYVPLMKFNL